MGLRVRNAPVTPVLYRPTARAVSVGAMDDPTAQHSPDGADLPDEDMNDALVEYRQVADTYGVLRMRIAVTEAHLARLHEQMKEVAERAERAIERLGGDDPLDIAPAAYVRRRRRPGETRALILGALPGTVAEVAAATGIADNTVRTTLRVLMRRGVVLRAHAPAPTRGGRGAFTYRAIPAPDQTTGAPSDGEVKATAPPP